MLSSKCRYHSGNRLLPAVATANAGTQSLCFVPLRLVPQDTQQWLFGAPRDHLRVSEFHGAQHTGA